MEIDPFTVLESGPRSETEGHFTLVRIWLLQRLPVCTQRCLNVYTTSITLGRRRVNVEMICVRTEFTTQRSLRFLES